jgi:hypothetical protein
MSYPAEAHGPTIAFLLGALGGHFQQLDIHKTLNWWKKLPEAAGLYMIFAETVAAEQRSLPIYCGYTGRTVRQRMYEHTQTGAFSMIFNGYLKDGVNFPVKPSVYWFGYVPANALIGRMLEGTFLETFDFVLNTADNEMVRNLLRWDKVEEAQLGEQIELEQVATHAVAAYAGALATASKTATELQMLIDQACGRI